MHLHHGISEPDTAENTRRLLTEFRDRLAFRHRCLAVEEGSTSRATVSSTEISRSRTPPEGALRRGLGDEDSRRNRVLCGFHAADRRLHSAQTAKINSLVRVWFAAHEDGAPPKGKRSERRPRARIFPLMVQGPLLVDLAAAGALFGCTETGEITDRIR